MTSKRARSGSCSRPASRLRRLPKTKIHQFQVSTVSGDCRGKPIPVGQLGHYALPLRDGLPYGEWAFARARLRRTPVHEDQFGGPAGGGGRVRRVVRLGGRDRAVIYRSTSPADEPGPVRRAMSRRASPGRVLSGRRPATLTIATTKAIRSRLRSAPVSALGRHQMTPLITVSERAALVMRFATAAGERRRSRGCRALRWLSLRGQLVARLADRAMAPLAGGTQFAAGLLAPPHASRRVERVARLAQHGA